MNWDKAEDDTLRHTEGRLPETSCDPSRRICWSASALEQNPWRAWHRSCLEGNFVYVGLVNSNPLSEQSLRLTGLPLRCSRDG